MADVLRIRRLSLVDSAGGRRSGTRGNAIAVAAARMKTGWRCCRCGVIIVLQLLLLLLRSVILRVQMIEFSSLRGRSLARFVRL